MDTTLRNETPCSVCSNRWSKRSRALPRRSRPNTAYPEDWSQIAKRVKAASGWRCARCDMPDQPGYVLTVHHLDMDPSNNAWWNLAPLCQRCHLTVQARLDLDQLSLIPHPSWLRNFVAGYHAHKRGLPDTKAFVLNHRDALLYGNPIPGYPNNPPKGAMSNGPQ